MAAKKRGKSGHICERKERRRGVGKRMSDGGEGRQWERGWGGKREIGMEEVKSGREEKEGKG